MAQPYVGEIRMFAGAFAPAGWMTCDGQLLAISEFDTLFNLIGTTYGGDGQSTFALPNLGARVPIHMGNNGTTNYTLADNGGVTSVTLTTNQTPIHSHPLLASTDIANVTAVTNNLLAQPNAANLYFPFPGNRALVPATSIAGGSQPHENMQPYLAITFIISLFGIYPSPT